LLQASIRWVAWTAATRSDQAPASTLVWSMAGCVRLTAAFTVAMGMGMGMGMVLVAVGANTLAEFCGALDESLEESLSQELRALQTFR
jgi:hypothetical protein